VLGEQRASGLLLHVSSLPGAHGHGDLGREALEWLDFLADAGQRYWQVLPIHPTGPGNSPYSGVSAFAGNPLFISLDRLAGEGLLTKVELGKPLPQGHIQFARARKHRLPLLRMAFARYRDKPRPYTRELAAFRERARYWLDDYCLYMALKQRRPSQSWSDWEPALRSREKKALSAARSELAEQIAYYEFEQLMFDRQWRALREHASERAVQLIGDIPIFVAHDSSDVWAQQACFQLDARGRPTSVSGVPPDYFSEDGQLWGTPLYDWRALKRQRYTFWVERIRALLDRFDLVRLDHFIGFERYWQIPATAKTAREGRWQRGPGRDLFDVATKTLGPLPFIAEDLGEMSPDVEQLRDQLGFPGMRVLQFGFGSDASNAFLPHNYLRSCVAYTGTHDNNTMLGWLKDVASAGELRKVREYLGSEREPSAEKLGAQLVRLLLSSVAQLTIVPVQDVLGMDDRARMNVPGQADDNWSFRVPRGALGKQLAKSLLQMTRVYGR